MVTPLKPVAPLKPSVLTPLKYPYHKHDSFSWNCWCKPVRDPKTPLLIVHNDAPYPKD